MSSLKTKNLKSRRFGRDPDFASGLKTKPMALIFSGYGLNTEDETKTAFEMAGGHAEIVHINDLLSRPAILKSAQIVVFPGGFSYGDDTGSGKAYGNRIKEHLGEALQKFLSRGTLLAGICNGFQIITNAGILPGALLPNDNARYTCRWVDLIVKNESPWLSGISKISLPIAHGEGKYYAPEATLTKLEEEEKIGLVYERGEIAKHFDLTSNPNGSLRNIAGITSYGGRVLGLMPHPERAVRFTQLPHWTYLRERYMRSGRPLPKEGPGLQIFKNAVRYFSE